MYLHDAPDFNDLLAIVGRDLGIEPALIEKDYWIMHCLYGLQKAGYAFELKGGTSLSKGYQLIHRFSEDIDIKIMPPDDLPVGKNHMKPAHIETRREYFGALAVEIKIPGIVSVERDYEFDDEKLRNAGIRLRYNSKNPLPDGLKEGILLEAGFDVTAPNKPCDISSWALDHAMKNSADEFTDNRAYAVACYKPGYTFVEKLQTISTKFRKQQETGDMPQNFMRHYYDVYCLLKSGDVQGFIGTPEYEGHKDARFPQRDEKVIAKNEAFFLRDEKTRKLYEDAYLATRALYYRDMPSFSEILDAIGEAAPRL